MSLAIRKYLRLSEIPQHLRGFSGVAPLLAAIFAPLAVLFDILGLCEKWHSKGGVTQPDPTPNLVLSSLSLASTVVANALLIFRFSTEGKKWERATAASVTFWFIKLVIATANLLVFGAYARKDGYFEYQAGFWSAVVSDVLSGLIFILLGIHFVNELLWRRGQAKNPIFRVHGRHFMLQETLFIAMIALAGLIFSKLEGWTYLDGVYFIMVTFLTIGYGDYSPATTAGKVLLFPITLLGIAMLGSLIDIIVTFFSHQAARRKARSRDRFERQRQIEEDNYENPADLDKEIEFLERLNERQDMWDRISEFCLSCFGFFAFWVIGGVVFKALEGWSYGNSLYFLYVTLLTIGYGDYAPSTPAGRVFFLIYALLAVPVMASFAVQAITQVITRISIWRLQKRKAETGLDKSTAKSKGPSITHAELVNRHSRRWENEEQNAPRGNDHGVDIEQRDSLLQGLLYQALEMEAHARRLLVANLPDGSKAQVMLKADRNVQIRDVEVVRRKLQENGQGRAESAGARREDVLGDADCVARPLGHEEMLDEVNRYREAFAAFLAAGSRIQRLSGLEKVLMERRSAREEDEGWDRERSMAAEREAADKTL